MSQFAFHQQGGRLKLEEDLPPFRRCTVTEAATYQERKKTKMRSLKEEEDRKRAQERSDWKKVQDFLALRKFDKDDVNSPKLSCLGLVRSYPLHQAAKEKNWTMMILLLNFGAELSHKDSHGKRAIYYVQSDGLEALGRALARENLHAVGMSSFEDFWATSG